MSFALFQPLNGKQPEQALLQSQGNLNLYVSEMRARPNVFVHAECNTYCEKKEIYRGHSQEFNSFNSRQKDVGTERDTDKYKD